MPLPPAPSKRAALLSPEAYSLKAAEEPFELEADTVPLVPAPVVQPARLPEVTAMTPPPAAKAGGRAVGRSRKPASVANPVVAERSEMAPPLQKAMPAVSTAARSPRPAQVTPSAGSRRRSAGKAGNGPARLFVLDTNVLLHDPMSLFRFEEHDIFLPMIVLEELDGHKKGMTEVARNGRQTSRTLDALVAQQGGDMTKGLKLSATGHHGARGLLFFQTEPLESNLPSSLPQGKADNQILGVVHSLRQRHPEREVILVSKDINMRVKARALGLAAEDYQNDKTLDDGELLYAGALALPQDFWTRQSKTIESWQSGSHTFYRVSGPAVGQFYINQFVYFEAPGEPSLYARVTEIRDKTAVLKTLKDYTHLKNAVWGVTSRNREQNFALNLLMDPEIDFVTLAGTAGTGKTLMALASGLTQVLDDRRYTEIIMTRATVSVGEDIGFLPGTEEEKMGPWMGALDDNLEFLAKGDGGNAGEWGRAATNELIRSRIKVKSMNFMRGRTFMNKYVIIDEAQNLTPKQMKTLITRAGPGTKIICMGNLAQIDTPYLTEGSSGLTFAVDRFKGWPHGGHITLARGERSRLADFASEVL
ncbi:MAG: PhoH family protein [Hydrogenophaga sp.]|uniref:PhoH family protein n=1 Tax=Hydrogenophaga sp. TaxID=1904254 RepID=UPI0027259F40|nr:PhoH family protein [Hydrogenophaga sp.]MDO8887563.1 PhoH family protein [Hydrogenophaga sp.]MDP2250998.1 PhoH family protein [Hydrogenophaga sp.]